MPFKPDPSSSRKLIAAARDAARTLPDDLPALLYLTDLDRSPDPITTAAKLPANSAIVYRHFGYEDRIQIAKTLRRITYRNHCKLLIGNDPDLAASVGADGVHWPEVRIMDAKVWRGRFKLMTCAAHSRVGMRAAENAGLDAALFSAVFPSNSPSASIAMGAVKFRTIARQPKIPLYALGGLTHENAGRISCVAGIAAISGIERALGGLEFKGRL